MEGLGSILGFDANMLHSMVITLINLFITVGIMYYLLYKPVKHFMSTRRERIKAQLDTAEKNLKEANDMKEQYDQKIKDIDNERSEIFTAFRKQANVRKEEIIKEAKHEAETLKSRALLEVLLAQEKAKDETKKQIIEVSTLMASKYVSSKLDTDTQNKLLEEVIDDLGDVKWLS